MNDLRDKKWIAVIIVTDDGIGNSGPGEYLKEDEVRAVLERFDTEMSGVKCDLKSLALLEG